MDRSIFVKAAIGAAIVFILWCAGFLERSETAQIQPPQPHPAALNQEGKQ